MTASPTPPPNPDDLTKIKGIGPTRQKWLQTSFQVWTFEGLAALSAAEIEARLSSESQQPVSRSEIEAWLAQAQSLAADKKAETPASDTLSPQPEDQGDVEIPDLVNEILTTAEGDWESFASFVVEFQKRMTGDETVEKQTKVHYVEKDVNGTWPGETWRGIASEELCQWMLAQLEETEVKSDPTAQSAPSLRPTKQPAIITINRVSLYHSPFDASPFFSYDVDRPLSGLISSQNPFALAATFTLSGLELAENQPALMLFNARAHARSLSTGANIHLGNANSMALDVRQEVLTLILPETKLSPDSYRLVVLVTLQGDPPSAGHLEVPLLRVV